MMNNINRSWKKVMHMSYIFFFIIFLAACACTPNITDPLDKKTSSFDALDASISGTSQLLDFQILKENGKTVVISKKIQDGKIITERTEF